MKVINAVTNCGLMAIKADAITHVRCTVYLDGSTKPRVCMGNQVEYEIQNTSYDEFVQTWVNALAS